MEKIMNAELIASKLKALRKEKGKSVDEVAEANGISKSALNMYEAGLRIPRDNIKIKLANYYEQPISNLFFD